MRRYWLLALSLAWGAFGNAGAATLTNWGTLTSVAAADCAAPCGVLDLAVGLLSTGIYATNGAANALTASVALPANAFGSAEAHAEVVPGGGGGVSLPHLRVAASAVGTGFVSAVAAGIQGYDYSGTGEVLNINVTVTGDVVNSDPASHTELGAFVYLMNTTQLTEFLQTPGDPLAAIALSDALSASENVDEVPANADPNERNPFAHFTTGAANLTDTLSITLPDGSVTPQQFYVAAFLYGIAYGDGNSVSSLNSLSLAFDPSVDLGTVAAASAVPLPAAAWLLLTPLALIARRRIN